MAGLLLLDIARVRGSTALRLLPSHSPAMEHGTVATVLGGENGSGQRAADGRPGRCYLGPWEGARMPVVNLQAKLAGFSEHWSPKIVAGFNGHDVMLVKAQGEFVW
ncbi:MAG: hypothetical protein JO157_05325, partial [Acetobacteraceae bacterium]|nr:hypothetical protein [Acetobacteraceae bacterium]